MNKTICRRLEFIPSKEVDGIILGNIALKKNKSLQELMVENAEYSGQSQEQDAGDVLNEIVSARIRYNEELLFRLSLFGSYILKLYTDTGEFFVGTPEYPCILTYSSDKIYVNLTFKATKPI